MSVRYLSITLEVEVECTPETTVDTASQIVDAIGHDVRSHLTHHKIVTVDVHDWDLSKVFEQ
jgi:hypothetical protein